MLELDEENGLRDYTVSYESNFDELGASVTSDEYFGTKIAGGYYVSGEGSYIEKIGNYYYLFMSYGFYSPEGGYNMRVFRSDTPDGTYVDANGNSAIFNKYIMNYSNSNANNNIGMKLMGNYKWDTMDVAEVAQGHNSSFVDADGKAYVVYHTKFADGTASHEIRVHQLFVNEDGWLVAAPYEYSGETISETGYSVEEVTGSYGMITHEFQIEYADLAYQTPEEIVLNADGTISGAHSGTWSMTEGTPYAALVIDGETYKGVFTEQTIDGSNITTMCFTVVSSKGLSIWGSGEPTDDAVVAQNAVDGSVVIPENTYADLTLPTEGLNGAVISWSSDNTAVLANDGKVTIPSEDTVVNLTETISKGAYYFEKVYLVNVKAQSQNDTDAMVVGSYFDANLNNYSLVTDYIGSEAHMAVCVTQNGFTVSINGETAYTEEILTTENGAGTTEDYNDGTGKWMDLNNPGGTGATDLAPSMTAGTEHTVTISINAEGAVFTVDGEEIAISVDGSGASYEKLIDYITKCDQLSFGVGEAQTAYWNTEMCTLTNITFSSKGGTASGGGTGETGDDVIVENPVIEAEVVELATNETITYQENPFKGADFDAVAVSYTVNFSEEAIRTGWDGIFSFYNSTTGGRVSFQSAPYICYNDNEGSWIDINQPGAGGTNAAADLGIAAGEDAAVTIDISKTEVVMTVNGEKIETAENGSGAGYEALLSFISECDQLSFGVGEAKTAYWWSELCTVSDFKMSPVGITVETEEGGTVTGSCNGSSTTLNAVPADNYEFTGWYADSVLIGTEAAMDISVCRDSVITAQFSELPTKIETSYQTITAWSNYLIGEITVKNVSEETLKSWSIQYDYKGKVITLWDATLRSQADGVFVVSAPKWKKNLKAGEEKSFKFIAKIADAKEVPVPENVVLLSNEKADAAGICYEVSLMRNSEWSKGYVGTIQVKNTGDVLIDEWTLEFDYEDEITSVWGGKIESHEGNHYVITNAGYNSEINPNGAIVLGFMGVPADGAEKSEAAIENVKLTSVVAE